MAKDISGSPLSFSVEGVAYRVVFDTNITEVFTQYEKDVIENSGTGMIKFTKRNSAREGLVLNTNAAEREQLKAFSDTKSPLKLEYINAAGDVYKCQGAFEIENNESEENRTTCKLMPVNDWTVFINN